MQIRQLLALSALSASCVTTSWAQTQVNAPVTTEMPVMDGRVGETEWDAASWVPDGFGLAGATYLMWREGLTYRSDSPTLPASWDYSGNFSFLLHNIEQNTTYANGVAGDQPAFNVFDIYSAEDSVNPMLQVVVRYDGFDVTRYGVGGAADETRTFVTGQDLAPQETPQYDWNKYWGVFALGGFNNTAFTSGLPGAIDNDNQLFEVMYRSEGSPGAVRRSIKDPDQKQNWKVVVFNDVIVNQVPEPQSLALVMGGLMTIGLRLRRRNHTAPGTC